MLQHRWTGKHAKWKKPFQKDHEMYDFIYRKGPLEANP